MAVLGYLEEVLPSEAEQVTDEDDEEQVDDVKQVVDDDDDDDEDEDEEQMGNLTCGETHFEIQKRECEESLAETGDVIFIW